MNITKGRMCPVLYWHDLSAAQQAEFDYLDTPDRQDGATFIQYLGRVYDLGEFMRTEGALAAQGWHGAAADSYFSGVLVRVTSSGDDVMVTTYTT